MTAPIPGELGDRADALKGFAKCMTCNGTDYIPAPKKNAWRLYLERTHGVGFYSVSVPCPACGGTSGKARRREMLERLAARKAQAALSEASNASGPHNPQENNQ